MITLRTRVLLSAPRAPAPSACTPGERGEREREQPEREGGDRARAQSERAEERGRGPRACTERAHRASDSECMRHRMRSLRASSSGTR